MGLLKYKGGLLRKLLSVRSKFALIVHARCLFCFLILLAGINAMPLHAQLIAYYPLDGDFKDLLEDPAKDWSLLGEPNFIPGVQGWAASFDGLDDAAETTSFVINDFSITFWVRTTDSYPEGNKKFWNGKGLINADVPGCTYETGDWGICLQETNKAGFGIGGFCDDTVDALSNTAINDGLWHFICCTRDGYTGEYKIYVNGGPAEDSRIHQPVYSREPVQMYLAAIDNEAGKFLKGDLDEVAFYDHVLSQEEINDIRENGIWIPARAVLISPSDKSANVPYQTDLQWTCKGDSILEKYCVYLDANRNLVEDPNVPGNPMLIEGQEVWPVSGTDPNGSLFFSPVSIDTEYFWRVDTLVTEPNVYYTIGGEPVWNVHRWIEGDIWSFKGMPEVITFSGPEDWYLLPDPVTHAMPAGQSIQFACSVSAMYSILDLQWNKDGIPLVIDDINYSVSGQSGTFSADSVLTIYDAGEADEGAYTLTAVLDIAGSYDSPEGFLYVSSEILAHRYSFDQNADDSVGDANGIIVDPNKADITFAGGQIVFNAGDPNNLSGSPDVHFVDLPNGLISSLGQ